MNAGWLAVVAFTPAPFYLKNGIFINYYSLKTSLLPLPVEGTRYKLFRQFEGHPACIILRTKWNESYPQKWMTTKEEAAAIPSSSFSSSFSVCGRKKRKKEAVNRKRRKGIWWRNPIERRDNLLLLKALGNLISWFVEFLECVFCDWLRFFLEKETEGGKEENSSCKCYDYSF
jgi:hypothetical protein